nr:hypothetical protein [Erysipelotrichaceae bacterium]
MNVREAIQKMNEKILEIRLAAAEQRPLLNDDDKQKLDELVSRSIEVVKNAGNKIEATVNELAQDEKVDEFLQRVGDRCEEACNYTIDRIRSFGAEYAHQQPEPEEVPAEEEPAPAEEPVVEKTAEEVPEETVEEAVEEVVEEAAETYQEVCDEVADVVEEAAETVEEVKEQVEETVEEVKDEVADVVEEVCECEDKNEECCSEEPKQEECCHKEEEPCCCEEPKQEECCCKEEEPCCCEEPKQEECCCKEEPAEEPAAEEPTVEETVTKEFKAEPEKENGEPSPIDVFLMSEDVQNVVKTVKDVTTNVRKGFDDYYNRPETKEEIRKTKKA